MSSAAIPAFSKVASLSRVDLVADQLRAAIAGGALAEGQQLIEPDLVASFGVSRGSIREAMQRLAQEGLLSAKPNKGMFVAEITSTDVVDIYNARRAVESSAALALMRRPQSGAIADLRREYDAMVEAVGAGNAADLTAADQRFHEVLVNSLSNVRLEKMSQTFLVETRLCLARLEGKYAFPREAVDEHLRILEAIQEGNPLEVLRAVDEHMDNAILLLTSLPQGDL